VAIFSPIIRPVAAVAFDLDDTLFDRRVAWNSLLEDWLGPAEAAEVEAEVIAADGNGHSPRREFFQWFADRFPGLNANAKVMRKRFRKDFPCHVARNSTAVDTLAELQARGIGLALLSNGSAALQMAKLRASGASPFFRKSHMLFSGTLGFAKPDPRAFQTLLQILAIPASEVLFVGDDLLRDIAGARDAGMQTCRLVRRDRQPGGFDADIVIDSLRDLPGVLSIRA
jgi:HAD superfamily hydrolase (TIGR01509 family)